ncbi:beta-glucan synthesis-associated protein [Pichia californica]|uniref:Beta-glucan synthesis-associated protein n=1 Tax=Pichia californica TaxID=460514 RepID=A0A9P6WNQ4_9ASCO|nr:beta-glucan synthesis-associated protein [[Candida] californica]KAG0690311.1 beta-glucan synthesis-associated protein [[Candida] californica]
MPPRNLTTRSPHIGHSNSNSNTNSASSDENLNLNLEDNPFNGESNEYESQSYDESSSFNYSNSNLIPNSNAKNGSTTPEIKQHLLNYNSSFHNSSTSSLLNPFSSTNKLNTLYTENSKASEYDRYPKRLSGSRVSSIHSSNSKPPSYLSRSNLDSDSYSDLSDRNSNPFLVDTDFSPFGGYPTSSFPLLIEEKEDDDYLHNPDPISDAEYEKHRIWYDFKTMDKRYSLTLLGLLFFLLGGAALFVILPALTFTGTYVHSGPPANSTQNYFNGTIEILSDYIYPKLAAIRTNLIDSDTPSDFYTRKAKDGSSWKLVFSDEFAAEGRTFYDGDDQFWYAPDIHYDATKDLEWYDPDAVSTANGTLHLRMDAFKNHDLYYRSGMLHSWNRLCFTQGILEISAKLPNYGNVTGLWPGLWSMGNLGRPGYMATTDGVWPYSYDACDAGITPNQSSPDGINYLIGQRLNSCTCKGEEHPNRGTGRGAPEIDIIEGEVDTNIRVGVASQSMQIAPMDIWYMPDYNFIEIFNSSVTTMNTYAGGPFQQAISATTTLNTSWYQFGSDGGHFQKYSYEYLNDDSDGYCRWFVGDNPTFTLYANSLAPSGNIGWRRISKEPMSIVMNLGISNNWAYIDFPSIDFPVTFEIDYVRIYQPENAISMTCDPADYPTYDYIEDHPLAYNIWNYTTWNSTGYDFPLNNLTGGCT